MTEFRAVPLFLFLAGMVSVGGGIIGCQPKVDPAVSSGATAGDVRMVRTELYFGLSKKGGVDITPEEFAAFVSEVVTPRFPDGLTIVDAVGQWRDTSGKISHERSKLLILLHEPTARDAHAIEEIREQYKSTFGQESVMRVTSMAGVSF
jgi:hypothetical protein